MAYLDFMAYARGGQAGRAQAERDATFDLQFPVAQAGVDDVLAARQANMNNYQLQAEILRDTAALPPEQRAAALAQRVQDTLKNLDPTNPIAARQAAGLTQFAMRQADARRQAGDIEGARLLGQTGFGINPAGAQDAGKLDMQGYVNALQNTNDPYYFSTTQNKWLPLAAERAALAQYGGQPATAAAPTGGVPAYAGVPQASLAPGMQPRIPALSPAVQMALQGPPAAAPAAPMPGSTGPTLTMPVPAMAPAFTPYVPAPVPQTNWSSLPALINSQRQAAQVSQTNSALGGEQQRLVREAANEQQMQALQTASADQIQAILNWLTGGPSQQPAVVAPRPPPNYYAPMPGIGTNFPVEPVPMFTAPAQWLTQGR
jgi:hypothetical protein